MTCFRRLPFIIFCIYLPIASVNAQKNFSNPLLPSGPDPWSIYHDGFYYYTNSMQDSIVIWKTRSIAELKTAERKTIYLPPKDSAYSRQLWAPEIHLINNKWYVYFAADDGNNDHHRMYVLENNSSDPMNNQWTFKGRVANAEDHWAIDGSVFSHQGNLYMIWSGWEGDTNGMQSIYIARMKNPWTVEGSRHRISSPVYTWERSGKLNDPDNPPVVYVNEGPQILTRSNKVFLIYSASGCWTDQYALGMLTASATSDLLDSASWLKSTRPVFTASVKNKVYAPGHNSFFKSPDGTEDWILYHANPAPGQGCGSQRSPRAQKFTWSADGLPVFGEPVSTGKLLAIPSTGK